jgi:hypothetical protein
VEDFGWGVILNTLIKEKENNCAISAGIYKYPHILSLTSHQTNVNKK